MVFESLVVDLLNRFLGDYVENLDRSQLKLGIWGGDVTLKSLDIKENALDELDLPVKVIAGHLGHLTLKIPWKNLYTSPVVATIDNVYLVAVPNVGIQYNEEKEEKAKQEVKQRELKRIEDAKAKEASKGKEEEKKDSFGEKMATQVIKNLQVKIMQIHIRYEDNFTNPLSPFAAGITLNNLSFETTDQNWKPCIMQDTVQIIHKVVALDSLAVYWNAKCKMFSLMSPDVRKDEMKKAIAASANKPKGMSYILGPINSMARLQLNSKPEQDDSNYTIPKVTLSLVMEEIAIALTKSQYQGVMELLDSLDRMSRATAYRRFRPVLPHRGHPKEWWQFAMRCVMEEDIRRKQRNWSWENMLNHRTMCRVYKEGYKDKLLGKKMTPYLVSQLEEFEKALDVFNITIMRKQAEIEVAYLVKTTPKAQAGWFGWLGFGSKKAPDEKSTQTEIAKKFEDAMTPSEKSKLYEAIGYQENSVPMEYPKEFVENNVDFMLRSLCVSIVDDSSTAPHVIKARLKNVIAKLEQRPSAAAMKVTTSMESFTVFGSPLESGPNQGPTMISTQTGDTSGPLLSILFETNPLDASCDQRLKVLSQSLQICYDSTTINNLTKVLKPPESLSLQQLQATATLKLEDFKELSATGLQFAIERHQFLELTVDLQPSIVIIPENGIFDRIGHQLMLNLGNFKMNSLPRSVDQPTVRSLVRAGSTEEEILTTMMSEAYDKFDIKIENVTILLSTSGEYWEILKEENNYEYILKPLNVSIRLEKAIVTDDPRLPKLKVIGELPLLNLSMSEQKTLHVMRIATSIPLPEDDTPDVVETLYVPTTSVLTESAQVNARALKQITKTGAMEDAAAAASAESDKGLSTAQMTDLELLFQIKEMTFEMSRTSGPNQEDQKMLSFSLYQLGSRVTIHTNDMSVNVFLGGITLEHLEFKNFDGQPMYMLQTPMTTGSSEQLLIVNYLSANKKVPGFETKYENTLQRITLTFSCLDVVLHQEAIISVMDFANQLSAQIEDQQKLKNKGKFGGSRSHLLMEPGAMKKMPSQLMIYKAKKTEKEIINMKILAQMSSVSVMITNNQANISLAKVAGLKASVVMENSKMTIHALLKDLLVSDPRPGATYVKILSTVSGDVMNVALVIYNEATENLAYLDMNAVDMSVTVHIGQMMVVYLNKYISAVLGFLDQFQVAKQKVAEASKAAADIARQGLEEAYDKASRMALDITLQAPVIIVPQNSGSPNALIADLGTLLLKNFFQMGDKRNEIGLPAIFENMQLDLQNLKLSRGVVSPTAQTVSAECLLLEPLSFTLKVIRNLTIEWHKEAPEIDVSGELATVSLTASQEDYVTVMRMLSENLTENSDIVFGEPAAVAPSQTLVVEVVAHTPVESQSGLQLGRTSDVALPVYKRVKFSFVVESFRGVLYQGSSNLDTGIVARKAKQSLASVELKTIAVTGEMLSDSSLWANVILVNCILNDTRVFRKEGVKRLMESTASSNSNFGSNNMIDVTFRQDAAGTFMDVKVNSFTLVVALEYMLTLGQFFSMPQEDKAFVSSAMESSSKAANVAATPSSASKKPGNEQTTTILLTLLKPDIVLIEDIENINSNAVIFNNEVSLKIQMNSESQYISGCITGLELFTAQYNPEFRDATMQQILNPCDITLLYKADTGEGQRINVGVNEFVFHVNPATVQLLSNILSALSTTQVPLEDGAVVESEKDLSLWQPKDLKDCNFWYLRTNDPKNAYEVTEDFGLVELSPKATGPVLPTEQMILEVKNILVTLEAGIGKSVVPLILLESSFHAEVSDWSSKVKVDAHLVVEMAYFNEKLAIWEPLIEPVETGTGHRPWELTAKVTKNEDVLDTTDSVESPSSEDVVFQPPLMSISVESNDPLQLTVTKVAMEVITNLSKAFGEAVSSTKTFKMEKPVAPYIIRNELGLKMSLVLEGTQFQVYGRNGDIKEVVLEPGTSVGLHMLESVSGRGGYSQGLAVMRREDRRTDYFFNVKIETDEISCMRTVYLMRTDKRYYNIPLKTYPGDNWGFIVSVASVSGAKIISLQSVVQVVNHFLHSIEVFYVRPNGNELLESCGFADPETPLHVPSYALYTAKNELFFKPSETFSMTSQPFIWKDLLKEPAFGMGLICDHKDNKNEKFYIQVAGEMEQVLYEHTSKKTMLSACHRLHLSPPAIIRNLLPFPVTYAVQNVNEEIILREGQSSEITSAEIGRHGVEIKLKNYLNCDWSCFNVLHVPTQELAVWTFTASTEDRKIALELGVRTEKIHNSLVFSLYCPFWMINRTGLQLTYRSDESNVICHPPEVDIAVLFSFRAKSFFSKKKASIKIEDSEWSDKFGLDVIGNSGTVLAKSKDGRNYGVGVQIKLSGSGLTKLVIFTPYCILVNNTPRIIQCKETTENSSWVSIPAQDCKPFWTRDKTSEIVARYEDSASQTERFSFRKEHVTLLRLKDVGGLNVECRMSEGSCIMSFSEYFNGSASVLLVNNTDCPLEYTQKGVDQKSGLPKQRAVLYTWQKPTGDRELIWSCGLTTNQSNTLSKDGLGEFFANNDTKIYWVSFLDGMQRVIFFTHDVLLATNAKAGEIERLQQEITLSLDGIGLSLVNNLTNKEILYLCIASTGIIWEGRKLKRSRFKALSLKDSQLIESAFESYQREKLQGKEPNPRMVLDGRIDIDFDLEMMYKPHKRCLRRSFQTGLWAQYSTSPHQVQIHAKINKLQIDNQLQDYVFPVVMAPVPLPKSVAQESIPKPYVEVSIVQTIHELSTVVQYKYFKALVQEFHIKIDQGFLNAVLEFFQPEQVIQKDFVEFLKKDKEEVSLDLKALASDYFSQEQKSFYDNLHLSPLKVHLSFSMTGSSEQDANSPTAIHSEFLNLLLQSIGVTLTEVQDVVFRLNYFERNNAFMTHTQFMNAVISHYSSQAIKQFYVLLLGLDVIGNPVGLLLGITSGVEDLFYEPFKGAIQGPEEFAEGLVLGIRSLFGHTIGGAAGAFSRITGTLGKGIAALTMDKDYQKKRRQEMNRRPQGFTQGLAQGGKGLVMGFVDGVTGVVTKPVAGAREEGFGGFMKGVGKGLIGIVARPTAGVVDFASGSLDVVKKAVELSDDVKRMRLPRFIQPDGIIRPYRTFEAEGLKLLLDVEKGKFASTDSYVAHVPVGNDKRAFLMVTTQRVIYVSKGEVFGQWNCDWNYTWDEVKEVPTIMEKGIKIMLKDHKKKKNRGLFGGTESGKIVNVKDTVLCNWIVGKMEETMRYTLQEQRNSTKCVVEEDVDTSGKGS